MRTRLGAVTAALAIFVSAAVGSCGSTRPVRNPGPPSPGSSSTAPRETAPRSASSADAGLVDAGAARSAGAIGTPHVVTLEAAAPDGRWVVICQARAAHVDASGMAPHGALPGATFTPYLVEGAGEGRAIDDFVAASPDGRYVVLVADGKVVLRDVHARTEGIIDADARDDRASFAGHRAATFDAKSTRLLHPRQVVGGARAIVRTLATGAEVAIDPGAVDLWRARFAAGDELVVLDVVGDDTNGNGRLEWPVPRSRSRRACSTPGPRPPYAAFIDHGDRSATQVAPASGGAAHLVPMFAAAVGKHVIVREASGRLRFEDGRELAGEKCHARIVTASAAHDVIVTTCGDPRAGPAEVHAWKGGPSKALGLRITPPGTDVVPRVSERLVPLYPGASTALLDLQTLAVHSLRARDIVVATSGDDALVRRGRRLHVWRLGSGEAELPGETDALPHVVRAGSRVFVSPLVSDILGRSVAVTKRRALAVDSAGRVLVAARDGDADRLPLGPLEWVGLTRVE